MNFHIVIHFLKTDWQRLRWLILAFWVLLLLAAWPALSFAPGDFRVPARPGASYFGGTNGALLAALEKQGELSPLRDWIFATMSWLFTGATLLLAGSLGFHTRMWTEGRPTRKRETIAAKLGGLLLFAVVPIVLVLTLIPLLQGFPWQEGLRSGLRAAASTLPRLAGVALFGALCRSWWRWLAGMFAVAVALQILPRLLWIRGAPQWIHDPLVIPGTSYFHLGPLWIAVVVLAILLAFLPSQVQAVRKVAAAIVAILISCHLLSLPLTLPVPPGQNLADWSGEVSPVLLSEELVADTGESAPNRGPDTHTRTSIGTPVMSVLLSLETKGLPAGSHAVWKPVGTSQLISEGRVITSTEVPDLGSSLGNQLVDRAAIKPLISASPIQWDGPERLSNTRDIYEIFTPVEPGRFDRAELDLGLEGSAYSLEKIVDVSLGAPVQVKKDGISIHIRRLDVPDHMPFADVCYVTPTGTHPFFAEIARRDWIPVIYLPGKGIARIPWVAHSTTMRVAPGFTAVRQLYLTGQMESGKPKLDGYDQARFMLLKRVELAKMTGKIHSAPLRLQIQSDWRDPEARETFAPPPYERRPDPATTGGADFEKWMMLSYSAFDSGWESRNIADYIPAHLERILGRIGGVQPPSTPEGKAITMACPESRKGEVIAALPRRNKDRGTNWIPDVIVERGWVQDAAPQIRKLAAEGGIADNPYSQIMLAALEDPQTYPALLEKSLWFDIYAEVRRLPGIEPALTEAVVKQYRDLMASTGNKEGDGRDQIYRIIVPAGHGVPEAFADLLAIWPKVEEIDRRVVAEEIRKVILLPGGPDDWKAVMSELAAKVPADFSYDTLARCWMPLANPAP